MRSVTPKEGLPKRIFVIGLLRACERKMKCRFNHNLKNNNHISDYNVLPNENVSKDISEMFLIITCAPSAGTSVRSESVILSQFMTKGRKNSAPSMGHQ